ncbi:hypothetical protein [Novosphingobium sp.]|uniref:hypothetical protein n=1 Tax=Novosphingobium sp. TaxID=1874826 RepID=UPI003D6CD970
MPVCRAGQIIVSKRRTPPVGSRTKDFVTMHKLVLITTIAAMTVAASPAKVPVTADAAQAACNRTIQQANAAAGHRPPHPAAPGKSALIQPDMIQPEVIRALDKRVAGCPVLVSLDGRMTPPPAYSDAPARLAPAQ